MKFAKSGLNRGSSGGECCVLKAIEQIAEGLVRGKNREALEKMKEHRQTLLSQYRMRSASWFRSDQLESSLKDDVAVLEQALDSLGRAANSSSSSR